MICDDLWWSVITPRWNESERIPLCFRNQEISRIQNCFSPRRQVLWWLWSATWKMKIQIWSGKPQLVVVLGWLSLSLSANRENGGLWREHRRMSRQCNCSHSELDDPNIKKKHNLKLRIIITIIKFQLKVWNLMELLRVFGPNILFYPWRRGLSCRATQHLGCWATQHLGCWCGSVDGSAPNCGLPSGELT